MSTRVFLEHGVRCKGGVTLTKPPRELLITLECFAASECQFWFARTTTGWFKLNSIQKELEIHAVLGEIAPENLHTCSMSPCQPVNERCCF